MFEKGVPFRFASLGERRQEEMALKKAMFKRLENRDLMRDIESEIADFHFRRPVRLPFLEFFDIEVRPFWRDRKPTPPLPAEYPPHPFRSHHY